MSMVAKVNIIVKNISILERSLEKMGYTLQSDHIYNKYGEVLCRIAYKEGEYSLQTQVEDYHQRSFIQARLNEIKQGYALEEVIDASLQNGWTALSQQEENGTIRIRFAV